MQGVERGEGAVDVLVSYHEASIPVRQVLQYATYNAAKEGIADRVGLIQKGMQADLVFFGGDLENDFAHPLFKVKLVVKRGRLVYPTVLEEVNYK